MARNSYAETQIPAGTASPVYLDAHQIVNGFLGHNAEVEFGTVVATGALMTVTTLFDPAMIMIINQTDNSIHFHTPSMADATVFTAKTGAIDYIAANGITLGQLSFTIGTDGNLNTAADVLHWTALAAPDAGGSL